MRYITTVFTVFSLLFAHSSAVSAQNKSSYGPEISAEDFTQHVSALLSLNTNTQRRNYIEQQFNRLGLSTIDLKCQNQEQGISAAIKITENSEMTTQYIAQLENAYQVAAVLEIAERFKTQQPRPSHDIRFSLFSTTLDNFMTCSTLNTAKLNIQPTGMENLDASSLVRDLNALYLQGK